MPQKVILPFYEKLSAQEQAVYRKSDAIAAVRLPRPAEIAPLVDGIVAALAADDRAAVERGAQAVADAVTTQLGVPGLVVEVLAVRPQLPDAELHGLYTLDPPNIRLWMRTAKKKRVVAWKTFLRTLLHELLHHLDFTLFELPDSYHCEGFFKRESSLFHQLVKA
jgi:hypothetical protein